MTELLTQIDTCELCGNEHLDSVLDLGSHPMCDDLVAVGDGRLCREFPIEILFCERCCTAHQRFQITKQELFPTTYHYRSRFTADVLDGMASLVKSCERKLGSVKGALVLDIGCNDGSLLDCFRARGARTVGVEPTSAAQDAAQKDHVTYEEFFSEEIASTIVDTHGYPDIITFTNVFAHIENLGEVLVALRRLMSNRTIVVIENHYLGSVLEGNQFDTFYHEHPRSYSYTSFVHIARSLGVPLAEVEFPSRYGGNIRVFLGTLPEAETRELRATGLAERESGFRVQFESLRIGIERWRHTKSELLAEQFHRYGKLRAKAFPGRAAILVRLLDLNETTVSAVYEKPGSLKIGHYVPGTRIPIASDDELFALSDQTKPLLNLAWHLPQEIREYLRVRGYSGPIIDVLQQGDFAAVQ